MVIAVQLIAQHQMLFNLLTISLCAVLQ